MRARGLIVVLLLASVARGDEPVAPQTPAAAAEAVRAAAAGDGSALAALAARDAPDPWLVADELIALGEQAALERYAALLTRPPVQGLAAHVAARRGADDDPPTRTALRAANTALGAGKLAEVLSAAEAGPAPDLGTLVGLRLAYGRAIALEMSGRPAQAAVALRAVAEAADRLGWYARAIDAGSRATFAAIDAGDLPAGLADAERRVALERRLGDVSGLAGAVGNVGLVYERMGRYEEARRAQEQAYEGFVKAGDRVGAARARSNLATAHQMLGDLATAVAVKRAAMEEFEALGARGDAAIARSSLGGLHYLQGEFGPARAELEAALVVLRALDDRGNVLVALNSLGAVHLGMGRRDRAAEAFEECLTLSDAWGHRFMALRSRGNLGLVRLDRGENAAAARVLEEALPTMLGMGDAPGARLTMAALGDAYRRLGDVTRARSYTERALAAAQAMRDVDGQAHAHSDLAELARGEGNLREARAQTERALSLWESIGAQDCVVMARANLGVLHADMGQHALALRLTEQALELAERIKDPLGLQQAYQYLAIALDMVGDLDRSEVFHRRALALAEELGDPRTAAWVQLNLGVLAHERGEHEDALERLDAALAVFRGLGEMHGELSSLQDRAMALRALGRHDEALEALEQARVALRQLGHTEATGIGLSVGQVGIHLARGDGPAALALLEQLVPQAEASGSIEVVVRVRGSLAHAHVLLGDLQAAAGEARRAAEALAGLTRHLGEHHGAESRERFVEIFDVGVRAARGLEDPVRLSWFLESGRAAAMLESLGGRTRLTGQVLPQALLDDERGARTAEASARAALERARAGEDLEARRAARKALDAARERHAEVVVRARRESKLAADLVFPQAADVADLRAALAAGDALVRYAVLPDEALALVVTREAARIVALGATADLEAAVEEVRLDRRDADGAAALERLERLLVAPLALGPVTRVLVSPDGALGRVPLPALFGARDVALVPSGTTYALLRGEAAGRGRGVLALGDPDPGASPDPEATALYVAPTAAQRGVPRRLPRAREEARAVGEVVLVDRQATETALRETLGTRERWRAVHLACHGWFDAARPLRSWLMLAPSATDDGFLTAQEVLRLHLPADLVVLSACESGRGKAYRAEGLMGLPRAFLLAGAPRVLCSLWKVDDAATEALMARFYALWDPKDEAAGLPAAAALRRAQEQVRSTKGWEHPYYWAAWVLWGLPD